MPNATFADLTISTETVLIPRVRIDGFTPAMIEAHPFLFSYLIHFSIEIKDGMQLHQFLSSYPSIEQILFDLPKQLEPFKQSSNFSLDVDSREEEAATYKSLLLTITTNEKVADATAKLSQIERNWLFKLEDENMQYFSFSLRFKP